MKNFKFEDLKNYWSLGQVTYVDAAKRFGRLNKINPFTGVLEDPKKDPANNPTFRFEGVKSDKDYEIGSVVVYFPDSKEMLDKKSGKVETKPIATFLKSFSTPIKQEVIFLLDKSEELKTVMKLSYGKDTLNVYFDLQHIMAFQHKELNELLYETENGYMVAHLEIAIVGNGFSFDPVFTTSAAVANSFSRLSFWNKLNSNWLKANSTKNSVSKEFALIWANHFAKYSKVEKLTAEIETSFFADVLLFISNKAISKRTSIWGTGERLTSTTFSKVVNWVEGKEFF